MPGIKKKCGAYIKNSHGKKKLSGPRQNNDKMIYKDTRTLYNHNGYGIIMEYIRGMPLDIFIDNIEYTDDVLFYIIYQILVIFDAYHSNGYMHCDIKPSNIIINSKFDITILDFQFANNNEINNRVCGTYLYMAPEVLKHELYTYKCDIYSMGLIVYKLIEKKDLFLSIYPDEFNFNKRNESRLINGFSPEVIREHCKNKIWTTYPEVLHIIIKWLNPDPDKRKSKNSSRLIPIFSQSSFNILF